MKHSVRRSCQLLTVGAVALLPVLGSVSAAEAQTAVTYDYQASALGQTATGTITAQVTATAPSSVAAGSAFGVTVSVGSITVPSSASGYTLKQIQNLVLDLPVPSDSTYVSSSLSGGSNDGSGTPSVSESNGEVSIDIPGPIAGGTTFTLPTLTLDLTAGAAGGTVETTLGGTGYSDPGLTFTAVLNVAFFSVDASAVGYPAASPVLTTTSIS